MAERADAESGDIAGQRTTGETGRTPRRRNVSRRAQLSARRYYRRHVRDRRGRYHAGLLAHLLARGELQVLPRRVARRYHLPSFVELYDIRFFPSCQTVFLAIGPGRRGDAGGADAGGLRRRCRAGRRSGLPACLSYS